MTNAEHQRAYRKRKARKDPTWAAREVARLMAWRAAHGRGKRPRRLAARKPSRNRDLQPSQVVAIREAYATGQTGQRALARDYLVSQSIVGYIVRGELYADCGGPRTFRIRGRKHPGVARHDFHQEPYSIVCE